MAETDVGAELRNARQRSGLTLLDVANCTNIPSHLLEAIERNALDELPGGLLTKGHLRAFAGEVGLDAERLIAVATPDSLAHIDLLHLLRVRFRDVEQKDKNTIQLLIVVACIAGFLYITAIHDTERTASAEAPAAEQVETAEES